MKRLLGCIKIASGESFVFLLCNLLKINYYKSVYFCTARVYTLMVQECTLLHGKSIYSYTTPIYRKISIEFSD